MWDVLDRETRLYNCSADDESEGWLVADEFARAQHHRDARAFVGGSS